MDLKNPLDDAVFEWVKSHQSPLVLYAARDLTALGGNVCVSLFTLLACLALGLAGEWRLAGSFGAAVVVTGLLIWGLKIWIGRPCPLQPDPYQHRLVTYNQWGDVRSCQCNFGGFPVPHLPCMPSGHTTASVVLYGILASLFAPNPLFLWIGFGLPVAIGLTRIYLSAHWTTDVIAGFGLGHVLLYGWRMLL